MWSTVPKTILPELERREMELNTSDVFWGDLIRTGSAYARYYGTAESGKAIVDICRREDDPPKLNILLEMKGGDRIEDTSAGKVLTAELRKREEKRRQELIDEDRIEEEKIRNEKVMKEETLAGQREIQSMPRDEQQDVGRRNTRKEVRRADVPQWIGQGDTEQEAG